MKLKWLPHLHGSKESEHQGAAPENALSKRREQVRRAQRSHRERKEAYIKALETEVLQLRTNEANLMYETKRLYAGIERLQATLDMHGIQAPWPDSREVQIASGSLSPEVLTTNSVVTIEGLRSERRLRVRKAAADSPPAAVPTLHSQKHKHIRQEASNSKKNHQPSTDAPSNHDDSSSPGETSTCVKNLDLPTLGTEFVLTLESPCLPHMEDSLHNSSAPPGHALTASAPLLFRASSESTAQVGGSPCWHVPDVGLDRLLDLSSRLDLAEEITPVQAWNCIRRHPEFNGLEFQRLRDLTSKLLKHVECHGFGAVIELATFEGLAHEAMASTE